MPKLFHDFKNLLESCSEEQPLQEFLKKHEHILTKTFSQGAQYSTLISKFKLADVLIPDFVIIGRRSGTMYASWDVNLIEIEPPILDRPLFNKKRQTTGRLRDAEMQIMQWQQWMKVNEQTIFVPKALRELKKKHAWDKDPQFYNPSYGTYQDIVIWYRIIIGRRSDYGEIGYAYRDTRWEESGRRVEIVPWDRLLDNLKSWEFVD